MGLTATGGGVSRLVGFDTVGEAFISGDRVLRGIYPEHAQAVREILTKCVDEDLFNTGIVWTRELAENPHPELGYETVLEHERIPFVSYPHEWPASMLREAAVYHLYLFEQLGDRGLTLKDWHPYNILFEGTEPRFVDFTSIIPISDLPGEPHLSRAPEAKGIARFWDEHATAVYESYRLMFEPYFWLPMLMMSQGRHSEARRRLYETALNSAAVAITRREAFAGTPSGRVAYELADRRLRLALLQRGPVKRRFYSMIRKRIEALDVTLKGSAYSSYYEEKKEAFSTDSSPDWTAKQHSVRNALLQYAPATVLDLGSNTGWFSILAARLGSSVVAVDLDESCIDSLYRTAKRDRLPILPLVANLTSPVSDRHALAFPDEPSLSKIGGHEPLYPGPHSRLQCEMVMALAVVHHLALGQGLSFDQIASIFAALSKKYLCAEFVALDDPMITSDPSFFPAYAKSPHAFDWYSLETFIAALRVHFPSVETALSHPTTRVMVVLSK